MVVLTPDPIDLAGLLARVQRPESGAVVLFIGTTRELTEGRKTLTLSYEAYEEMATREIACLVKSAQERWSLVACEVIHRLGEVPLAEASVAVVASAPHRGAAFEAARWLIDSLKLTVPIWKKEHWADGSAEWVHPRGEKHE
jgi:molybdopterin synthase catalytic subunit